MMTHIELSITPMEPTADPINRGDPLAAWAAPVATAEESCLVLDSAGLIIAASLPLIRLLGRARSSDVVGRHVLDPSVLTLIDFTAAGRLLAEAEREQIPPLLALISSRPARGLMRLRYSDGSLTLDAIATPLLRGGVTVGSLSFFGTV
jgi:hypothetical protein